MATIFDMETVALDDQDSALLIIDQTQLPGRREILRLKDQKSIWDAIYLLKVRGAPAIGVAAAFGIYLAAKEIDEDTFDDFYKRFEKARDYLDSARPTAVNLSWALRRMDSVVRENREKTVPEIKSLLLRESAASGGN